VLALRQARDKRGDIAQGEELAATGEPDRIVEGAGLRRSMTPAILVEVGSKSLRRSRRIFLVAGIAERTGHPGAATIAVLLALPTAYRDGFRTPPGIPRSAGRSCEQLRAGWRELHVGAALVQP
jgi:hypothetical protein